MHLITDKTASCYTWYPHSIIKSNERWEQLYITHLHMQYITTKLYCSVQLWATVLSHSSSCIYYTIHILCSKECSKSI